MSKFELEIPEPDGDTIKELPVTANGDGAGHKLCHIPIDFTMPDGARVRGNANLWIQSADEVAFTKTLAGKKDAKGERIKFRAADYVAGNHALQIQVDDDGVKQIPEGVGGKVVNKRG